MTRLGLLAVGMAASLAARAEDIPGWAETWPDTFRQAQRDGSLRMTTKVSPAVLPSGPSEVFVLIDVRAPLFPVERQAPLNVALVVDRSDSMHGARLASTKRAAREVVNELDESDYLSIIAVSDDTQVMPSSPATPLNRQRMLQFIDKLTAGGGSNLSGGIDSAIGTLTARAPDFEFNRILVLTDGIATRGVTDKEGLGDACKKARVDHRIHVSAVGIGEDYDESVLNRIVKDGWGFISFVRGSSQAARVGHLQKLEVLRRAAEQVELKLKFPRTVDVVDILNFAGVPSGGTTVVALDQAGPGDSFQVVLRMKANVPPKSTGQLRLVGAELSYLDTLSDKNRTSKLEIYAELGGDKQGGAGVRDPAVVLEAAKAITAKNLVLAEERFEEANRPSALMLLDETEDFLGRMMKEVPKDALAEQLVDVAQAMDRYRPAQAPKPTKKAPERKPEKKKRGGKRR